MVCVYTHTHTHIYVVCVCVLVIQLCPTLCDPMDCSPPGSSVHRISQARILEWVAIPFSKGSSWPRDGTCSSCICREVLYHEHHLGSPIYIVSEVQVAQSCPTLCDPVDYTVHGILQARILDWVAFPLFRASSQPRDRTQVSCIAGGFFTSWATREAPYIWYIRIRILLYIFMEWFQVLWMHSTYSVMS